MPDKAFAAAPPSPNVEDRRGEFSELQHLLYSLGLPPDDQTDHGKMGWTPGMWFDPDAEPDAVLPPPTKLGAAVGADDLDNRIQFGKLLAGK